MTKTQDELKAALTGAIEWDKARGYRMPYRVRDPLYAAIDALRSPDPEVERLREDIEVAAVQLQLAGGWLREAGDDGQRANTLLNASNRARAALSSNSGGR